MIEQSPEARARQAELAEIYRRQHRNANGLNEPDLSDEVRAERESFSLRSVVSPSPPYIDLKTFTPKELTDLKLGIEQELMSRNSIPAESGK